MLENTTSAKPVEAEIATSVASVTLSTARSSVRLASRSALQKFVLNLPMVVCTELRNQIRYFLDDAPITIPALCCAILYSAGLFVFLADAHHLSDPDISIYYALKKKRLSRIRHGTYNMRGIRHSLSRPMKNKQ